MVIGILCRGGGFISLQNLLFFSRKFPVCHLTFRCFCMTKWWPASCVCFFSIQWPPETSQHLSCGGSICVKYIYDSFYVLHVNPMMMCHSNYRLSAFFWWLHRVVIVLLHVKSVRPCGWEVTTISLVCALGLIPEIIAQARGKAGHMGVSICSRWSQHILYVDSNARPQIRSRFILLSISHVF
jgi:hypothetical protein